MTKNISRLSFQLTKGFRCLRKPAPTFRACGLSAWTGCWLISKREKVVAIVRGLRAISDFEFEFQMALMNRKMEPTVETIFMMPKEELSYISSRIVKEIARLGGNVESFVPDCVVRALAKKFFS